MSDDARDAALERQLAWLKAGGLAELADPDERDQIWHTTIAVHAARAGRRFHGVTDTAEEA